MSEIENPDFLQAVLIGVGGKINFIQLKRNGGKQLFGSQRKTRLPGHLKGGLHKKDVALCVENLVPKTPSCFQDRMVFATGGTFSVNTEPTNSWPHPDSVPVMLNLWQLSSGLKEILDTSISLNVHKEPITKICWHTDRNLLLSGSKDEILIWSLNPQKIYGTSDEEVEEEQAKYEAIRNNKVRQAQLQYSKKNAKSKFNRKVKNAKMTESIGKPIGKFDIYPTRQSNDEDMLDMCILSPVHPSKVAVCYQYLASIRIWDMEKPKNGSLIGSGQTPFGGNTSGWYANLKFCGRSSILFASERSGWVDFWEREFARPVFLKNVHLLDLREHAKIRSVGVIQSPEGDPVSAIECDSNANSSANEHYIYGGDLGGHVWSFDLRYKKSCVWKIRVSSRGERDDITKIQSVASPGGNNERFVISTDSNLIQLIDLEYDEDDEESEDDEDTQNITKGDEEVRGVIDMETDYGETELSDFCLWQMDKLFDERRAKWDKMDKVERMKYLCECELDHENVGNVGIVVLKFVGRKFLMFRSFGV